MINSKNDPLTKTGVVLIVALICCILWGSAFPAVKTGYELLDIIPEDWASQMVFAGVRFFIAGWMALIVGSIAEKKLLIPSKSAVPKIAVISTFQTILQYFFYYIGLAHTTGVKASIIVAANVFTAILISSLMFHMETLTMKKIIGCIIGFSGIILINFAGLQGGLQLNFLGDGFIFFCTIASGFSSVFMKKYSANESPILLSGWQFVFGGAVMWIVGIIAGGSVSIGTNAGRAILIYLSFVSAAAYSLWAVLLRHNPVSKVTVFGFLNPLCGVILSSIILHETGAFSLAGGISLLLVCAGIFIVNYEKRNKVIDKS